jgi:hypothetical protein
MVLTTLQQHQDVILKYAIHHLMVDATLMDKNVEPLASYT